MQYQYPHIISNGGGETITFTRVVQGAEGDWGEGENLIQPNAGPPMHTHHLQDEAFTVVHGKLAVQVLGEAPQYLYSGESAIFKAGIPHKFWNAGDEPLLCKVRVTPALNLEYFLTEIFKSTAANGGKRPSLFDAAWLLNQYRSEYELLDIPKSVQRLVFPIVLAVGRLLGKYKKFEDAPPAVSQTKSKKLSTTALLLFFALSIFAQDSLRFQPKLLLDFPVLELPHLNLAADMAYNKRIGNLSGGAASPTAGDYLRSYESVSMQQALAITKNVNATNYYFTNKLWNKWVEPDTKKKALLNRLAANLTAGVVDYTLAYYLMVFGPVWLHEEFHRNGITHQCAGSHNDTYYRLSGNGSPGGSVTQVRDEDMTLWKASAPQEMVRSFAAGIEAQYELVRNMRKDNFFSRTNYPNVAMNILITKQAVDYVNLFKQEGYDNILDTALENSLTIAERDFVGWDFTAWVYDLHRPEEAYTERGIHPSGKGIDRNIKRSDLSAEEVDYLSKMGRMQYLNFLSPAMIGISRIKVNDRFAFSFAGRHILNSFGYDVGADVFLDINGSQWFVGLHGYQNHERFFPGIEVEKPDLGLRLKNRNIPLQARAMFWLQPKDQLFKTDKASVGGLLQLRAKHQFGKSFSMYAEAEAKTKGWVAGNPYLNENFTLRTGVYWNIQNLKK